MMLSRHRMGLGVISPEDKANFLANFQPRVDDTYNVLSEAFAAGVITEAQQGEAHLQINDIENAVMEILETPGPLGIGGFRTQLDELSARLDALRDSILARSRGAQESSGRRMFWWSVAAITLGLGAGFAWLAISKRKAK